ncbi:MAG TPA: NAD(+) synthase [Vicinamibacterales bacterium]|nr:NAD(+) synthase [Vicinamibacterales bacterium]
MTTIDCTWLSFDAAAEVERIVARLREILSRDLKRRGLVVGLSGGIDSSVTAALGVRAFGADRVFGLLMPEKQSDPDTLAISQIVAEALGLEFAHEDISAILESVGFYRRYDDAVRELVPQFADDWKSKVVIQNGGDVAGFNYFELVVQSPSGDILRQRLPLKTYLGIVASTNFKQRVRKMLEYYHADRLNFAVAGTPNRLEYDQGFFVKNGDGSADVKPIAHLYKSQVYELGAYLKVPEKVRNRLPTTDTYSLAQAQDEFYFLVPYHQMDLCLYAKNNGISLEETVRVSGLSVDKVQRVWIDIDRKRAATRYHHLQAVLVADVPEIAL